MWVYWTTGPSAPPRLCPLSAFKKNQSIFKPFAYTGTMVSENEIKKYLDLPWSYSIEQENGYYVVHVNELPGICSDGQSIPEAIEGVQEAISAAIELYLELGEEVPIPSQ
jgi:predicted RNase H-like HicB family nuclease